MTGPIEPPPSRWELPDPAGAGPVDLVALGGDLEPGTVLDAYRRGLFPMRVEGMLAWWSPDPRGVIPLDGFHRSRSLRGAIPRFEVRSEQRVRGGDAGLRRPGARARLDRRVVRRRVLPAARVGLGAQRRDVARRRAGRRALRLAHRRLVRGESMFHRVRDASKVACWATVELLRIDGATLFDVQWTTPHLRYARRGRHHARRVPAAARGRGGAVGCRA